MLTQQPGLIQLRNTRAERGRRGGLFVLAFIGLAAAATYGVVELAPKPWARPSLKPSEFVSGIPIVRDDLRLVVSVLEVHKSVLASSPKRVWGFDLGTTKVSVSMPARIHYAVDLSGPEAVEFNVDPQRRELIAVFPDPVPQAIELIASRKQVAIEPGWARLRALSGHALQDGLERGLYDAVKTDASAPAVLAQIKEQARPVLGRLLLDYLRRANALGPDGITTARVRFRGDTTPTKLAWLR